MRSKEKKKNHSQWKKPIKHNKWRSLFWAWKYYSWFSLNTKKYLFFLNYLQIRSPYIISQLTHLIYKFKLNLEFDFTKKYRQRFICYQLKATNSFLLNWSLYEQWTYFNMATHYTVIFTHSFAACIHWQVKVIYLYLNIWRRWCVRSSVFESTQENCSYSKIEKKEKRLCACELMSQVHFE